MVGGSPEDGRLVAFLAGFLSRFFDVSRANGRNVVRCFTSPVNHGSIAFHLRMGFHLVPGDAEEDGRLIHRDHDGPG